MTGKLKITSWNINGIKTLTSPFKNVLDKLDSDIICFQETKSNEENLNYKCAVVDGYNSYFSFCQTKPGYSGVCIYCRNPVIPATVEEGLLAIIKRLNSSLSDDISIRQHLSLSVEELQLLESEGRAICAEFHIKNCECGNTSEDHSIFVVNVYCPMTDSENIERIKYKTQFNALLQLCVEAILSCGSHLLLVGDLNLKHKTIDIAETMPEKEFLTNYHRQWFNCLLIESQRCPKISALKPRSLTFYGHLVDTFRFLYPTLSDQYSCFTTKIGPRITNVGTRIDYIICDHSLLIGKCRISTAAIDIATKGSDHYPMVTTFDNLQLSPSQQIPLLCSINIKRFRDQSRITSFFVRSDKTTKRFHDSEEHLQEKIQKIPPKNSPSSQSSQINDQWKHIFMADSKPPCCSGHDAPCVQRLVSKEGPNKGRKFWCCSKKDGVTNHKLSKCNYFSWCNN